MINLDMLYDNIPTVPSAKSRITLLCDNSGAVFQAREPKYSNKSRHVHRKFHLIRDYIDRKEIDVRKVGTEDNIADPLTKPLSQSKHDGHVASMGIKRLNL